MGTALRLACCDIATVDRAFAHPSVTGHTVSRLLRLSARRHPSILRLSTPPGARFCTGSAQGKKAQAATRWGSKEDRPTNLRRVVITHVGGHGLTGSIVPGEGTPHREGWCCPTRKLSISPSQAALAANSNFFSSTSMRCMITASLRARATFAFCIPTRLASCIAQLLSPEPLTGLVRMMWAA